MSANQDQDTTDYVNDKVKISHFCVGVKHKFKHEKRRRKISH
jgi:hypothetical protein